MAKREDVYELTLYNFEYGDAADRFIEDEWKKMLSFVARYRPIRAAWLPVGLSVANLDAMLA